MTHGEDTHNRAQRLRQDLARVLHVAGDSAHLDFALSSFTEHNPYNSTEEILDWLTEINRQEHFRVEPVPLAELDRWAFDRWTGDLCHESGRFFSIRGLEVHCNLGPVKSWTQPIIDQPEVGILGIITQRIDGILYFLMQAKAEPGNINTFQLSPTVQATRSNYTGVHGGKSIPYLEHFLDPGGQTQVLVDQLQSEQGARFYRKRNRNIIIRLADDARIEIGEHFRWLTLRQIRRLLRHDNLVNMDARSVISNISLDPEHKSSLEPIDPQRLEQCLGASSLVAPEISSFEVQCMVSGHGNSPALHDEDDILHTLARYKFECELESRRIPLNEVREWRHTPYEISHVDGLYFSVIGVRVEAASREVVRWDQPIVRQVDPGIVGFVVREIGGVLHFLTQLKMESGNLDLLEMAPTVQCITGSYEEGELPPFVADLLQPTRGEMVFDTLQSEEGGRFFREENRNLLLHGNPTFPVDDLPPRYLWLTLSQLKRFLKFNNFLNVEARSLLSFL